MFPDPTKEQTPMQKTFAKLLDERDPRKQTNLIATLVHDHGEELHKTDLFFVCGLLCAQVWKLTE